MQSLRTGMHMKKRPSSKTLPITLLAAGLSALALPGSAPADTFLTITNGYGDTANPGAALGYGGLRDGWVLGYPTGTSPYAGTLGFSFYAVHSDLLITALGYYDGPNSAAANAPGYTADGLLSAHAVGIWDGTGTLIASALVPTSGTFAIADFQYIAISPVTLIEDAYYTIGGLVATADGNGTGDVFRDCQYDAAISATGFTLIQDGPYSPVDGENLQRPTLHAPGYIGGNFIFTPAPEPGSLSLFACGSLALAARRRPRR